MKTIKELEAEIDVDNIDKGGWGDTVEQKIQLQILKDVLEFIDEILARRGIPIFPDETYEELNKLKARITG